MGEPARPTLRNFKELDDIKALALTAADIETGAAASAAIAAEATARAAADTAEAAARVAGLAAKQADMGVTLDTDGALTANSDTRVPSQRAVKTAIANSGVQTASLGDLHDLLARISAAKRLGLTNDVAVARVGFPDSTFPVGTTTLSVEEHGALQVGPEQVALRTTAPYDYITTFLVDPYTRRIWTRSAVLSEQGDPPDLLMRLAGPDNTYPGIRYPGSVVAAPAGLLAGGSMGQLGWVGWYGPDVAGAAGGGFAPNLSVRIWAVTKDDFVKNTGTGQYKVGAQLNFATTPMGFGGALTTRLTIDHDGTFLIYSPELLFENSTDLSFLAQALGTTAIIKTRVVGDGTTRYTVDSSGKHQWGDGQSGPDVAASRTAASTFKFTSGGVWVPAGVVTFAKAGPITDADYAAGLQQNGMLGVDTTNKRLYARTGAGEHKSVALQSSMRDVELAAFGLKTWAFSPLLPGNNTAPTSQKIYFTSMPVRKGETYSSIWVNVVQAAVGAVPAGAVKLAVYDATLATQLAVTADLKSDAKWTSLGWKSFAITPFTAAADGIVQVCFLKNGTFAGTDLGLGRATGGFLGGSLNGVWPYGNGGTGQTDISGALTPASEGILFWFGLN